MAVARVIDVQEFINAHKVSPVQVALLVLCFLIVAIGAGFCVSGSQVAPMRSPLPSIQPRTGRQA